MFKKPLAELKTSAPLRSSDRRKLKQRVLQTFPALQADEGDLLVPEGLLSQKFSTHLDEPGVAYFSPEGDPLWFSVGKGSDDLIPTVYTLWKRPDLLPFLSTPAAVVPKLVNGADLMIPGVVQHSPALAPGEPVAITQYHSGARGYPLAVGRMAVPGATLVQAATAAEHDVKGKAVYVLHTWKDALWEMGASRRVDVPAPRAWGAAGDEHDISHVDQSSGEEDMQEQGGAGSSIPAANGEHARTAANGASSVPDGVAQGTEDGTSTAVERDPAITPEEMSHHLHEALLQALSTTLASLPPSSFPISASTFWSSYILPARPAHPDASTLDAKHSTHKSVKAFLKACAKEGLIKLKDAKGGDVVVAAVFPAHTAVAEHRPYRTVKDVETRLQKAGDRERKEKEAEEKKRGEIQVTELWKPFGSTVGWFVAVGKDTSELYTLPDLKTLLNAYISSKNLVNAQEQQYINVGEDAALLAAIANKHEDGVEFLKREEVLGRLHGHMQSWYEIRAEGRDVVRKKGQLKPVQVMVKIRQGRKASTLVTGFEPFFLGADDLAEELRRICASSTSVSPIPGKTSDMEVMVQGKQIKAVTDHLVAKGVPKKWIESADLSAEKKKK
ncbi:hypothetical protein AcV7_010146 [Taiwanofungus camphoratus]|nr:hypothetical protein AcV7_010146 [Antrodia cinnamomea]